MAQPHGGSLFVYYFIRKIAGVEMKKRIGIITGIIALLAAGAFLLLNYTDIFQADAEAALDDYVSHYENGDYEEIYESLHSDRQERYAPEDVIERYEKLYEDLGVESRSIGGLELNEAQSTEENRLYEGDWTLETAYGE